MALDERDFYDERNETKPARLQCPHCRQEDDYELLWIVRTKKRALPPRADERDRAKFANARNYMVRRDDMVVCKNVRCHKRFEVAGVQSVAFNDEAAAALARRDQAENPVEKPADAGPRVPRGFGRPTNRAGFADKSKN